MDVIILAAGYATRLYPLTENKPKPLLEVSGKPMMEHIIAKLEGIEDIKKIHIVTNNKFTEHFKNWLETYDAKIPIDIVNDNTISNEDRLGAIGDIHHTINDKNIDDDILVIAGDNLFEMDLKGPIKLFQKFHHNAIVLYDVKDIDLAKHYGVVEIEDNIVKHFEEKPTVPRSTLISTGIYMFPKKTIGLITKYLSQGNDPDKTGDFIEWLHKREDIYAHVTLKKWYDIGNLKQLKKANEEYKTE